MRIDDDNKVIWLTDTNDLAFVSGKSNLDIVSELVKFDGSYDLCSLQNDYFNGKHFTKRWLLMAILNNYKFKLEEERYYWRKKKEYLAEFEEYGDSYRVSRVYLNYQKNRKELSLESRNGTPSFKTMFTESEVRELLNQDFDKFEKVEIDE